MRTGLALNETLKSSRRRKTPDEIGDAGDPEDAGGETESDETPDGETTMTDVLARMDSIEAQLSANESQEKAELVKSLVANEKCPLEQVTLDMLLGQNSKDGGE